ncbi:hypothetical protein COP2_029270 [Malus domestica]
MVEDCSIVAVREEGGSRPGLLGVSAVLGTITASAENIESSLNTTPISTEVKKKCHPYDEEDDWGFNSYQESKDLRKFHEEVRRMVYISTNIHAHVLLLLIILRITE